MSNVIDVLKDWKEDLRVTDYLGMLLDKDNVNISASALKKKRKEEINLEKKRLKALDEALLALEKLEELKKWLDERIKEEQEYFNEAETDLERSTFTDYRMAFGEVKERIK